MRRQGGEDSGEDSEVWGEDASPAWMPCGFRCPLLCRGLLTPHCYPVRLSLSRRRKASPSLDHLSAVLSSRGLLFRGSSGMHKLPPF